MRSSAPAEVTRVRAVAADAFEGTTTDLHLPTKK